jgi:hypothetical protein
MKRIIFDYESLNSTKSQGETLMEYLDFDTTLTIDQSEFLSDRIIEKLMDKVTN